MKLTAENVRAVMTNCLFLDGEDRSVYVQGDGVLTKFGFHPGRLAANRDSIMQLLNQLPDSFRDGGASFLQGCVDRFGEQWGEHPNVEQLLALGHAAGYVKCLVPRQLWSQMPGGMPYFSVDTTVTTNIVASAACREEPIKDGEET